MPASTAVPACSAPQSPVVRVYRTGLKGALLLVSLAECGMAGLMAAAAFTGARLLFLFCTLSLLAAAVVAVRSETARVLLAAQAASAAALIALLFAAGNTREHAGPGIALHGTTYSLTLPLALLLFAAIMLARLLRRSPADAACHCS